MTSIFYLHGSKLCYNLGSSSLQSLISPESYINFPQTQTELDSSFFFDFDDDNNLSLSNTSIDSLFDTNVKDCSTAFLPNFYSTAEHSLVSLSPKKPYVNSQDEEARHPKRQKITTSENYCCFTYASELSNAAFVPNPSWRDVNIFPSSQALVFNACGNQEMKSDMKRGNSSSGSTSTTAVSAQSIAARERRRKITEKTQELGKLIPGGNKMKTAEMFQAAYKYVKFLQAQLAVLLLIRSIREQREQSLVHIKELQVLASPIIQEKLYSDEKCLVPKEFVQALANNHEIQSKSFFEDIEHLLQING